MNGGEVLIRINGDPKDFEAAMNKSMQNAQSAVGGLNKAFAAVTAAGVAAFAACSKVGMSFEAQMSTVEAISGATGAEMQALTAKAKQMGIDTKFSATEAGQALEYMAMAGWKSDQMLNGIEGVMNLAAASGENLAGVSDIVTDALTALGKINDAAIYADPSRETLVQDIIVHEFSHRMKQLSPDSWQKYADYAINDLKKTGRYDGIYSEFTKHYDGMAESEIHEEMAADYAYKMFDSEESLTELIRQDKPLAEKIKDVWFALLEKLGRDVTLKRAKNMWKMCLTEAGKTAERGGNQSGTKYKIAYTTENKPVVVVEEDFLKGIDPKDYIKETKKKLAEFSPGIQINGRFIAVNKTTRGEFTFSKNSRHLKEISPDVHSDKMRIAENIDDAVKASTDYVGEAPKHERKDNIQEFARGDLLIQVGSNKYRAEAVVGWDGNNMILYDIVKMRNTTFNTKKESDPVPVLHKTNVIPSRPRSLSDNSVTQPGGVVKGGDSSNQGKNSGGTKYMLNPNFNKAVDNWNDNLERRTGMSLLVGETSEPLLSIGVKKQKIYWDTTKINDSLNKHPDIDLDVIKTVPHLLENPVLVMTSKAPTQQQGNNRILLFGDLYNENGIPVLTVLELEPDNGKFILDEIKIVSTHARADINNPKSMKPTSEFIKNHTIKYVDPDKKRTAGWLARTGLQLPFLPADSGSIGTIAYKHGVVKGENSSNQGKNGGGAKYMLVGKINGYDAYRSDFPESMPREKRLEKFKERIASIFNLGRVSLNTDTKKITVTGDKFTMKKNIYGDEKASDKEANARIDALYDIADILGKSRFVGKGMEESYKDPSKKPKNAAHKNVKYWYKFRNTIVFDGDVYDVTFNIRDKGKEQIQYLMTFVHDEKKTAQVNHTVKKTSGLHYPAPSSNSTVTHPGGVVKGKNSSNQGKICCRSREDRENLHGRRSGTQGSAHTSRRIR